MKKIFCLFFAIVMFLACRGSQEPYENVEDEDVKVTFKVCGNFGCLVAKYKNENENTYSTASITVKKNGLVDFQAEPMNGFEVKSWKIENAEFSEGGKPKNKSAKVIAKDDFVVSVEFKVIEGQEEQHFTIQSLDIGNNISLKLTTENYRKTMNKIKDGDVTKNLESIVSILQISIETKENMKEIYINGKKYSPDADEPHLFKGSIEAPEIKKEYEIMLKGEKLKSVLIFSVKKINEKISFPESEIKLFIDGGEVSSYVYNHLSDIDEMKYPLIETKEENVKITLKTSNPLLAGKVIYGGEHEFDETSMEASFNVSNITENVKVVKMEIIPKSEDNYERLIWNFKIVKQETMNFVPAFLYVDYEFAPNEVQDNLTSGTPKTLEYPRDKAIISVGTYEKGAIESVVIDGKQADFAEVPYKNHIRYQYDVELDIPEIEREIVVVITPNDKKNYDKATWRFKIKKI